MFDFVSTRDAGARADSREALVRGLAPDGGLYVNSSFPRVNVSDIMRLDYPRLAARILKALLPGFSGADIDECCAAAYSGRFLSERVTPVIKAGDAWALELFHGETAAFKDLALALLPRLMARAKRDLGIHDSAFILTATSGDTGSAAMNGFSGVTGAGLLAFYPLGGVSEIQRMQMTCMRGENIMCCALRGNFDDCQSAVKRAFQTLEPPKGIRFSSANSINIGRLMPQVAYYYSAYSQLTLAGEINNGDEIDFVVPTGNFGDILAGEYARNMGLPIGRLVCASNANRVLTDFLSTGVYDIRRGFVKTLSPSMDILISSNLERLVYLAEGKDADCVRGLMARLAREGYYRVSDGALEYIRERVSAYSFDDALTLESIARAYRERGYVADPHTAVGFAALDAYEREHPGRKCVVLATASPFKFPASVLRALGAYAPGDAHSQIRALSELTRTPAPASLTALEGRKARFTDEISLSSIDKYILERAEALCIQ